MQYGKSQYSRLDCRRRAVTLIEMLIVLFIISLLAVMALRALPNEDQRPREAARMASVYLASTKSQGSATSTPAGIILRASTVPAYIDLVGGTTAYSTLIDQCEVPPSYSGSTYDAALRLQDWTFRPDAWTDGGGIQHLWPYWDNNTSTPPPRLKSRIVKAQIPTGGVLDDQLIRYGDKIQINSQGAFFTIIKDDPARRTTPPYSGAPPMTPLPDFPTDTSGFILFSAGTDTNSDGWIDSHALTLFTDAATLAAVPWPAFPNGFSNSYPFKIVRQPIKSATTPLQLPAGVGIDLVVSGDDTLSFGPRNVAVLFSPNGSVDSVYIGGNAALKPTLPIYLLCCKLVVSSEDPTIKAINWFDLRNIIISINPQTGTISTNPVYPPYYNDNLNNNNKNPLYPLYPIDPPLATYPNKFNPASPPPFIVNKPLDDPANDNFRQALFYSRKFARDAQTMGGKR